MLEINWKFGGCSESLTVSDTPYVYYEQEYRGVINEIMNTRWYKSVDVRVIAQGKFLTRILANFHTITKPVGFPEYGFVWTGDDAVTIMENIALALQAGATVVVDTVGDYNFNQPTSWRTK
jgi:hypothetical protein